MAKEKGIEAFSPGYDLLKKYVDFCFGNFYKIEYINKEITPFQGPIIFACNHQNALMDALCILNAFNWQPVFLGRSDIFRNKTLARILRFLKILPVYRIRDGYDQLTHNRESFNKTFDVLRNHTPIIIFPEGNHEGLKKIRILKKGIARIAFDYQHLYGSEKSIRIIPVGLNYSDYHKTGSTLLINFGEPIEVSAFESIYKENPAKANLALLKELSDKLKEVSWHIAPNEIYDVADFLLETESPPGDTLSVFNAQQQVVADVCQIHAANPEKFALFQAKTIAAKNNLKESKITPQDIAECSGNSTPQKWVNGILSILLLPLHVYAVIQNFIPRLILNQLLKKFRDPHFKSSVRFVGIIFLFPMIYLLQSLVVGIVSYSYLWAGIYFISLLPSLWVSRYWRLQYKCYRNAGKINFFKQEIKELKSFFL